MRILIFAISFLSTLNIFIHYAIINPKTRSKSYFVIEIFRLSVFFLICYYYCNKASGLLPNKRIIRILLRILFIISLVTIMVIGGVISKLIVQFN